MLDSKPTNLDTRRVSVVHLNDPAQYQEYRQLLKLFETTSDRYAKFAGEEEDTIEFYVLFSKPWTEDFAKGYWSIFEQAATVRAIPEKLTYLLEQSQSWPAKDIVR
ncbi:hypothetical protein [Spirosoma flavum]|uniref:Uncharacterized protein n=1 Tax=Spirosoma flavum TaxID=2048557 RepID=A0ABW6AS99_9BACT